MALDCTYVSWSSKRKKPGEHLVAGERASHDGDTEPEMYQGGAMGTRVWGGMGMG